MPTPSPQAASRPTHIQLEGRYRAVLVDAATFFVATGIMAGLIAALSYLTSRPPHTIEVPVGPLEWYLGLPDLTGIDVVATTGSFSGLASTLTLAVIFGSGSRQLDVRAVVRLIGDTAWGIAMVGASLCWSLVALTLRHPRAGFWDLVIAGVATLTLCVLAAANRPDRDRLLCSLDRATERSDNLDRALRRRQGALTRLDEMELGAVTRRALPWHTRTWTWLRSGPLQLWLVASLVPTVLIAVATLCFGGSVGLAMGFSLPWAGWAAAASPITLIGLALDFEDRSATRRRTWFLKLMSWCAAGIVAVAGASWQAQVAASVAVHPRRLLVTSVVLFVLGIGTAWWLRRRLAVDFETNIIERRLLVEQRTIKAIAARVDDAPNLEHA